MTTTLYLYIGLEACGSGLVRQALVENHAALLAAGVGLCSASFDLAGRKTGASFPDAFFAHKLEDVKAGRPVDLSGEFQALSTKARTANLSSVILAADSINAPAAAAMVEAAKQYFECKVIYYFARQDDWLVETWRRGQFKTGLGLHAFVDRQLAATEQYIFRDTLNAYANIFGAEAMRVRLAWPKVLEGGHIVADFWHAIDAAPITPTVLPEEDRTLTDEMRNALKESPYLFDSAEDRELTDFISSFSVTGADVGAGVPNYPLDDDTRRHIMERFKAENHWIKHTFLKDFAMPGWNSVPKRDRPDPVQNDPVTVAGVTEALNLNFTLLKELREDISKIKKNMGLK